MAKVRSCVRAFESAIKDTDRRDALQSLWQLLRSSGTTVGADERRDALPAPRASDLEAERKFEDLFEGLGIRSSAGMRDSAYQHRVQTTEECTSLTHGEMGFHAMRAILMALDRFGLKPHGNFVDLGSGVGRPVIAASLLRHGHFRRCFGIELLSDLHAASALAAVRLKELPGGSGGTAVSFSSGDIFDARILADWANTETAVLLVHGTCFGPQA